MPVEAQWVIKCYSADATIASLQVWGPSQGLPKKFHHPLSRVIDKVFSADILKTSYAKQAVVTKGAKDGRKRQIQKNRICLLHLKFACVI